jgi:hypothetical protein
MSFKDFERTFKRKDKIMIWDLILKDKTLKGSFIVLLVYLLEKAGIQVQPTEIAGGIGTAYAIIGLIHKIIKKTKSK